MKNRVIIVFNYVPESLHVYNLMVSDEDLERIKACSNQYGNSAGMTEKQIEDTNWLSLFLEGKEPAYSEQENSSKLEPISCSEPCTIVVTGFFL